MIFSVSEFNEFIDEYLDSVGEVVVEGEISEIRINQGKWVFMTIKDESASLRIFSFTWTLKNLSSLTEGMLVRVKGSPGLYKKNASFSLQASEVLPSGEGALRLAFEQLRKKLSEEGLFDVSRKRSLVSFPEKIGLLTARNSRAYSDFIKIINARMGGLKIYFYPVQVQGEGAVDSIINGLDFFNKELLDLDLLVITRGGGSLEDLQAFNDERVVRKVYASKIPVVAGVGHEADVSLVDLVADLRASTPSNAAELIVRDKKDVIQQIEFDKKLIRQTIIKNIDERLEVVRKIKSIFQKFTQILSLKISNNINTISNSVNSLLTHQINKLSNLKRLLRSLNYQNVLRRGYSITFSEDGSVLKNNTMVKLGDKIKTLLYNGKINSKVLSLNYEEKTKKS